MVRAIGRQLGRNGRATDLFRASLLVLVLLLLHLALMTTEHHDPRDHDQHGATVPQVAAIAALAPLPSASHGDHDAPRSTLDGCPVGVAILPLLLTLLAIAAVALNGRAALDPADAHIAHRSRFPLPPPLAAPQRRALLQIFLI